MTNKNKYDILGIVKIQMYFEAITEEMFVSVMKSSYSHVVREGGDSACVIYDSVGRLLALSASSIPALACMTPSIMRRVLEQCSADNMKDKEIYILNDPYLGASHLNDIFLISPLFMWDQLIGFAIVVSHIQEIGGICPGGISGTTTEIYQEGLRIPLLRLCDSNGLLNETLIEMLKINVRTPKIVIGDLRGEIAAIEICKRKLREVLKKYSYKWYNSIIEDLFVYSEYTMKEKLKRIQSGKYKGSAYIDDDGVNMNRVIKISVLVSFLGDGNIIIDLSDCPPQTEGPINMHFSLTEGTIYYVLKGLFGQDVPFNEGCTRPIKIIAPKGLIVNPRPPAAVNARMVCQGALQEALLDAFGQADQSKAIAGSLLVTDVMSAGGVKNKDKPFVFYDSMGGGLGATCRNDGLMGKDVQSSSVLGVPTEVSEMEYDILVKCYELVRGSGGLGKYIGGLGCRKDIIMLCDMVISGRTDSHKVPPRGIYGGLPGKCGMHLLNIGTEKELVLPSKYSLVKIKAGDVFTRITSGGGGYGSFSERDPDAVKENIRNGFI